MEIAKTVRTNADAYIMNKIDDCWACIEVIASQYIPRTFLEQWTRYTAKQELATQLIKLLLNDNYEKNNAR